MTRFGRGQVTRLALLLAVAGCVETNAVSGKAPERLTRDLPHDEPASKPSRTELYKSRQNESAVGDPRVEITDKADARIGAAETHVFHRASCPLLKDVPVAQQVRFTSQWDALDGGYRPCDECKSIR